MTDLRAELLAQATAAEIVVWLNSWLAEPITERERVIVAETLYAMRHPADVERANERHRGRIATPPAP